MRALLCIAVFAFLAATATSGMSPGPTGALEVLGSVRTASDAHCVAADDRGNAYVCDPGKGRLLVYADGFPAAAR